ncbi:MAG: histidine triad nucleotide-binding protein [Clostridia bacterium]|nr:histidine triad nucleotide-binding protein [Clostridia bacterium]
MNDCIFCKIAKGEIDSQKIYEDDTVLAFNDLDPQAPTHILVIPKEHIESAKDINESNSQVIAHIFEVISYIAGDLSLNDDGFRVVSNSGENAGQSVNHLHFHLLSGRPFAWPPG